jgi:DNA repair protein RecN (Recombination protein N)
VLCITHLPQIARFGEHHFRISKHVQSGRTVTRISSLNRNERVEEIARMLGGEQITETTLKHASELVQGGV